MEIRELSSDTLTGRSIPYFFDHCLFYRKNYSTFYVSEHLASFGLIAMLDGSGSFLVNGDKVYLDQNRFLIINKGSTLSFSLNDDGGFVILLYFNSILSELVSEQIFFNNTWKDKTDFQIHDYSFIEHVHYNNASLKNHLTLLLELGNSCASFNALKADMIIRSMLEQIIEENYQAFSISTKLKVTKKSTQVDLYKRLAITKKWIELNFTSTIQLAHLAEIAMLNAQHFLRLFKKAFHITPHQYITTLRIELAKRMLLQTDSTISEICYEVGFESLSSFSILFKQHTGSSPSQYKAKNIQS